jgi:hypothetical protein
MVERFGMESMTFPPSETTMVSVAVMTVSQAS